MHWVVTGASGFLGEALRRALVREGHTVTPMTLRDRQVVAPSELAGADVLVNLAGASIGRVPWTPDYRRSIRESRIRTTTALTEALSRLDEPPAFLCQSAIGIYGEDRGDEVLDEDAAMPEESNRPFLAEVVSDWEAAADSAAEAGVRVVRMRSGVVLDRSGGAFRLMTIPFRLGLGAKLGSGRQYMGVVTLFDWIAAVLFLGSRTDCSGVYNVAIPTPPTNAEFTKALGAAVNRPTLLTAPAPVLRLALGGFSTELLGSRRVVPRRLLDAGFEFGAPDIDLVLQDALHH